MNRSKNYIKAFFLTEVLVVVALVAVMLLVAIPSWQGMVNKNHAMVYVNELMTALQFARATAIKLGKPVDFCASKSHKKCDGLWRNGSIVVTSGGKVMRVLPPIFATDKLDWNHGAIITFAPTGFSKGQQGSFYYCPKGSPENARAVVLNQTGRVKILSTTHDAKEIPCNF